MPVFTPSVGAPAFARKNIGIGDVQVVARDGDVEIVLQRQRNRVIQRQIELALVHQRIDACGVRQIRRGQVPRRVRSDRIGKMRHRLGIIQDRQRPRLRRILRRGRGGRLLGPDTARVNVANKTAAAISRMVEAKRANGIYSSPFSKTSSLRLRPCSKKTWL